jgi:hypothetical protein
MTQWPQPPAFDKGIPAALPISRSSVPRWRVSHWFYAAFLIMSVLWGGRLLLALASSPGASPVATVAAPAAGMTKAQFRIRFDALCSNEMVGDLAMSPWNVQDLRIVREADLIAKFGPPSRTQTIVGQCMWYWQCTDGLMQIALVKRPDLVDSAGNHDALAISSVNDY